VNKFTRALPSPGHWLGPAAGLAGSSSPHGLSCTQPQKNTKIKNNKKIEIEIVHVLENKKKNKCILPIYLLMSESGIKTYILIFF
jgi:hypothetical protein